MKNKKVSIVCSVPQDFDVAKLSNWINDPYILNILNRELKLGDGNSPIAIGYLDLNDWQISGE